MAPNLEFSAYDFIGFGNTKCQIVLPKENTTQADFEKIAQQLFVFEQSLSRFKPSSEISLLNAHTGEKVHVSPLTKLMLEKALEAYGISQGLVHIGILKSLKLAGYTESLTIQEPQASEDFDKNNPQMLPPLPNILEISEEWVQLQPGYELDLGGIAKGLLADLFANDAPLCVMNLGGDISLRSNLDGFAWPVGLCNKEVVNVPNGGVATSSIVKRAWGEGLHHLINPDTSLPANTSLAEVSVISPSALLSEVLAKMILIGSEYDLDRYVNYAYSQGASKIAILTKAEYFIQKESASVHNGAYENTPENIANTLASAKEA